MRVSREWAWFSEIRKTDPIYFSLRENLFSAVKVFDEIDANIGGKIANSVGNKLQKISKNHQLICITHLPQVASFGSNHIFVSKSVVNGRTYSKMKVLDSNERPEEIARMLSGDKESKISIEHAKSLLVDES